MTIATQLAYEERVKAFAADKTFLYCGFIKVNRGDVKCDACGSRLIQIVNLVQDRNGNYYLIGSNCETVLHNEQKVLSGSYEPEHRQIAERLVSERKPCSEFYPLTCTVCGCVISADDAVQFDYRCEHCWYEDQRERM